jgi:putative phosphoribosyl transferase
MKFRDRRSAGRLLAQKLAHYRAEKPVVVAIPCGGVPVGVEVADSIGASLDVSVVHKIGAPSRPQWGHVAVVEGGHLLAADAEAWRAGVRDPDFVASGAREAAALEGRARRLRAERAPLDVKGRPVIVVDDGAASGLTAWAAVKALRERGPARVTLALPVAAASTVASLGALVDEFVCLVSPESIWSLASFYGDFGPVSDDEAAAYLRGDRDEFGGGASLAGGMRSRQGGGWWAEARARLFARR